MDQKASILIADIDPAARAVLAGLITELGHQPFEASDEQQTMSILRSTPCDVLLLDVAMPGLSEILQQIRADRKLRRIPVVMIAPSDDLDSVVRCLDLGAEGFLYKPANPVMLRVRVKGCLEKKRLHDEEWRLLEQLQAEKERSEALLRSIFPAAIADRLRAGEVGIAESFPETTILFADINRFAHLTESKPATEVVRVLNAAFSAFDKLVAESGVEKIKTIGDAYMVAAGVPVPRPDHAQTIADLALRMQSAVVGLNTGLPEPLSLRIGIDSGAVVAGVLGATRLAYDLWGNPVKGASRMEAYGVPGAIHVTAATAALLRSNYLLDERGTFYVKGQGDITTYLLRAKRS
jgi:class 3 adenylate cyclase/ActR/RegA family two-component response regulator